MDKADRQPSAGSWDVRPEAQRSTRRKTPRTTTSAVDPALDGDAVDVRAMHLVSLKFPQAPGEILCRFNEMRQIWVGAAAYTLMAFRRL